MKKILPLLVLFIIVLSSCTKRKESFLLGKWEDVPRVATPEYRNIWTFQDGNRFIVENFLIKSGQDSLVETLTGEYDLDKKLTANKLYEFYLTLRVSSGVVNYYNIDGKYWVEEVNRDNLKITREEFIGDSITGNPFVRYEMIKL